MIDYFDEINNIKDIRVNKVGELKEYENGLEVELEEVFFRDLKDKSPYISRVYTIFFEYTIAYSVLNESYAIAEGEYIGNHFRIYTKSAFLDYIRSSTLVCEDYPCENGIKNFELVTLNHCISIASCDDPKVTKRLIKYDPLTEVETLLCKPIKFSSVLIKTKVR